MSSNLQNWLNCCELPQCWLCIYLHLKTYLVISPRSGWPARSWWERAGEWAAPRAGTALRGGGTAPPAALGQSPGMPRAESRPHGAASPPMPAAAPHLPARRRCGRSAPRSGAAPLAGAAGPARLPAPLGPGAAKEAAASACPSPAHRAPLAPGAAGRGRGDGAGAAEGARGGGRGRGAEPRAGERLRQRGGGAARVPAQPRRGAARSPSRPQGWTLPQANAARSEGNEAAGAAELARAAEGSGRSTGAP